MLTQLDTKEVDASKNGIEISGLKFYADYLFQVRPCVKRNKYQSSEVFDNQKMCGTTWAAWSRETGIGESTIMPEPTVTFVNSTEVNIAWSSETFNHGGPIKRYDIRLELLQENRTIEYDVKDKSSSHMSTSIVLDSDWSPNCENESSTTNLYNFSIRAVTQDEFGKLFYSPWSPEEVVPAYCYRTY